MAGDRFLLSRDYLLVVTAELGEHPAFKWLQDRPYFVCSADGAAAVVSVNGSDKLSAEDRAIHRHNLLQLLKVLDGQDRLITPDPQTILKWGDLASRERANSVDPLDAQFLALAIQGEFTVIGPHREIYDQLQIDWFDPAADDPKG